MAFRLNAGPLASALAGAQRRRSEGEAEQYGRQRSEQQYQDSMLMRELAMRNQQEQAEGLRMWREQQAAASIAEQERRAQEAAGPKAPVRGTPEYLAALEQEKQIEAKYQKPADPRPPVRGSPEYLKMLEDEERLKQRLAPPKAAGPSEVQQNRDVDRLQQRYQQNPQIKNAYSFAGAISDIQTGLSQGTGFGDLQAIYGVVKMFDPNSVVREGEIKLSQAANSLPGRVRLLLDNWKSGRILSPQMRQEIDGILREQMTARESLVRPVQAQFGGQARARGVQDDSAFIAPSPFEGIQPGAGSPGRRPLSDIIKRPP